MDDFGECSFLADMENEFIKHQELNSANERAFLKQYEKCHQMLVDLLLSHRMGGLGTSVSGVQKLKRERDILDVKLTKLTEQVNDIHEECKIVRSLVNEKQNEIPEVAQELENLKKDLVSTEHERKNDQKKYGAQYKSCLVAKDFYKKNLGFHVRILKTDDENGNQIIFTFESTPQTDNDSSMPHKSVKVFRSTAGHWKLLNTNPTLPNLEQLSTKLEESQDIQGLLAHLGKVLKTNKKIKANVN
ncbi:hypothetical protein ONE63_004370 [Megalurothrips usitatus]|uniref:Kinetochore protein SPC25 n=1 Tax=Megalurothrips usitatus TaxID=439358 RepID=A0AAV7X876_9NEOP|nr:hypothetical protein ONE63_004370 [Megalurothrips usitatus]